MNRFSVLLWEKILIFCISWATANFLSDFWEKKEKSSLTAVFLLLFNIFNIIQYFK